MTVPPAMQDRIRPVNRSILEGREDAGVNIELFHDFLAVARHGGFSNAATALHLSQPSLSRHIADLEAELGERLLTRTRPPRLTPAGEILLRRAGEIWDSYETLIAEMRASRAGAVGKVRMQDVTYFPLGLSLVASAVTELKTTYPNVEVELVSAVTASCLDDVKSGHLDISFAWSYGADPHSFAPRDPELSFVHIADYRDELRIAVGVRHHLAGRQNLRLEDFAGERFPRPAEVLYDPVYTAFAELCRARGFTAKFELVACQSVQKFWLQDFSDKVLVFSKSELESNVLPESSRSQVRIVPLADADLQHWMYAVHRSDTTNSAGLALVELFARGSAAT